MNLLAAVILYAVMLNQLGMPDPARPEVIQINAISKQSPAEQAGLQVGDILLSINSQPITNTVTAHDIIYANLGQPVTITYQRGQAIREVTVTPRTNPPQEGAVGISMGTPIVPVSLVTAIPEGVKATYRYSEMLVGLIGQLIRGKAPAEQGRLVGLKGMVDMYETVRSSEPPPAIPMLVEVLGFFTSITISLGLINLLPVPALDGGRILFALPEVVIHRRIPPKYENMVNGISFLILIALMILINLQDFINPARLP
jgi:regulator of sigma E protease